MKMKNILIYVLMTYFQHSIKACVYIKEGGVNYPMVLCEHMLLKIGYVFQVTGTGGDPITLRLYNITGEMSKSTFKSTPHKRLIIVDSDFTYITCDTIENLHTLKIEHSKLETVNSEFWKCGTKLKSLHIVDSQFMEPFSTAFLKNQPDLRNLTVKKTEMPTRLTKYSFKNLPKLEELYLDEVGIRTIDSDSFVNLPNLRNLTLRNNIIAREPKVLGLQNLKHLEVTRKISGTYQPIEEFIRRIPVKILTQADVRLCKFGKDGSSRCWASKN